LPDGFLIIALFAGSIAKFKSLFGAVCAKSKNRAGQETANIFAAFAIFSSELRFRVIV
jgi:hypothetical protein